MNPLLIISTVWVISEIILSRMMRAKNSQKDFDQSSLKILWATIIVSVTAGILLRRTNFTITGEYITVIYYSGIIFICLGLIIRWVAILTLKKSFTVNVAVSESQKIVQSGIYKYIRHPAYSGILLSFFGLGISFNNFMTLTVIFIPIVIAFYHRIRVEEKVLSEAFGQQYTDYIQRTWRSCHLPRLFFWIHRSIQRFLPANYRKSYAVH